VSVGLGFLTKGADAFQVDSATGGIAMDENGQPIRVDGETTHFRMIPTHLSAIYRLTALDDRWRVPLVPYGRLGLSYYLWWITRPDGSISEADGEEARGGSLGWQGSVGLAIRAERLDPDAGVNLRNELGIEHAGFFAELTFADVDGFGAGDKLSLGDLTWFGGINFEF
jgi:hypothetical protein